jgi:small subunit ribosomal protein S9
MTEKLEKTKTAKATKEKKPRAPRKTTTKKAKKEEKPEVNEEETAVVAEIPAETDVDTSLLSPEETEGADNGKKFSYYYALGRRKNAVAQVRLYKKGDGEIKVNNREMKEYFPRDEWQNNILAPLKAMGQMNKLNVIATVKGGGINAQSEAIRLGVSRALLQLNPIFRRGLKKYGYLTRDARKKERKKPGLKRARRAPQWQKR